MENHIEDSNQDEHGLENLSEKDKAETKEILDGIEKDSKPDGDDKQKSEADLKKEADDKKAADDKKIEDDKKKTDLEETGKKTRRESKLVPSYLLGIEKTNAAKRETELLAEIETLKKGANNGEGGEKKPEVKQSVEIKSLVEKIVADNAVEDPKVIQDIFEAVDAYVKDKTQMPADLVEKLKTIDDLKAQAEIKVEEANFNSDFDKEILPLIKAEYGDDIPAEKIEEIKATLKSIAYTPEYEKISYDEIYRGKKDFRDLYTPKKRSAEGNRNASGDLTKGTETYTEEISEEDYNKLSPADQQKYEDAMAAKERRRS